jgi:ribonuclease HI
MKSIQIFTDGASRGNPGAGGWGAIIVTSDRVSEFGGEEKNTTNNRMELNAVIKALSRVKGSVTLHTDSSYVLNGATKWVKNWEKNGWETKQKESVLNKDLWVKFLKVSAKIKIKWLLLKGHSGIPANERCDVIATRFADGAKIKLYSGPLSKYPIDITRAVATRFNKNLSHKSKSKAYSYVSMVNGIVKIHSTWAECEKRVKGVSNALFKKSFSEQDEQSIILAWRKQSQG